MNYELFESDIEPYVEKDSINPLHYKQHGMETIDVIKNSMSEEAFKGYLVGNILKYVSRYKYKNGIEDLKKAKWYLSKLLQEVE